MRGFRGGLFRFLIVVAFAAVTLWPDYGLVWFMSGLSKTYPEWVSLFFAAWVIVAALLFPFPLRIFQLISCIAIFAAFATAALLLHNNGLLDTSSLNYWIIAGIFLIGTILGWLLVAPSIWRFTRGIAPVEDQHE